MIDVKPISNVDRGEWRNLLIHSSTASYFQSPDYYDFICSLSFLTPFGWAVYSDSKLKALVCGYVIANGGKLKQFFSRRAIIQSGLLLDDNVNSNEIELLLFTLKKLLLKKVIYIEIRNSGDYCKFKNSFEKCGFRYHPHLNYIVDTAISEQIENRYSESKKRQIRKATEQNVVCEPTTSKAEIHQFYTILSELYKQKVKKPLFPVEFFEKFVKQNNCQLIVVKTNDKVIGGIAITLLPNKAVYEWFICGDTNNFNYLYPSVMATHKGIKFAVENGYQYFDFMGAGKPGEEYGVRDFKEKFGGELFEWGRFISISNGFLFKIGKFVIETLKEL